MKKRSSRSKIYQDALQVLTSLRRPSTKRAAPRRPRRVLAGRSPSDITALGGRAARMALDFIEGKIGADEMSAANKAKLMKRLDQAMNAFIIEFVDSYKGLSR